MHKSVAVATTLAELALVAALAPPSDRSGGGSADNSGGHGGGSASMGGGTTAARQGSALAGGSGTIGFVGVGVDDDGDGGGGARYPRRLPDNAVAILEDVFQSKQFGIDAYFTFFA